MSVLQLIYEGQPVPNALELALKQKKPSSAQTIMQFAMLGAAHESDVAIMLQESLVKLGAIYPKILLAALEHKGMLLSLGTAQVHEVQDKGLLFFPRDYVPVKMCNKLPDLYSPLMLGALMVFDCNDRIPRRRSCLHFSGSQNLNLLITLCVV